jgi:hypothetical protein
MSNGTKAGMGGWMVFGLICMVLLGPVGWIAIGVMLMATAIDGNL